MKPGRRNFCIKVSEKWDDYTREVLFSMKRLNPGMTFFFLNFNFLPLSTESCKWGKGAVIESFESETSLRIRREFNELFNLESLSSVLNRVSRFWTCTGKSSSWC